MLDFLWMQQSLYLLLSLNLSLSLYLYYYLSNFYNSSTVISKDGVYHCRLSVDDTVSLTDSLPPFLFQSLSVSFPLTLSLSLSLSLSLYYYISNFYNSSTAYLKGWCIPCSTFRGCNSLSHSLTHSISLPSSLTNTLSLTLTSTSQARLISKDGVYHA